MCKRLGCGAEKDGSAKRVSPGGGHDLTSIQVAVQLSADDARHQRWHAAFTLDAAKSYTASAGRKSCGETNKR
jgi:hypothetical protein